MNKKLSIITYVIVLLGFLNLNFCNASQFSGLAVKSVNSPISESDSSIQNISVGINTKSAWKLIVVPTASTLENFRNPKEEINLNHITLYDSSGSSFMLMSGKPVVIASGNKPYSGVVNFSIKLKNSDDYMPGIYSGILKFTLLSNFDTACSTYYMQFRITARPSICIIPTNLDIDVPKSDLLKKDYIQTSSMPSRVYIKSNSSWKLVLKRTNKKPDLKFSFKVTSLPENASTDYGKSYTAIPDNDLIIARGTRTKDADSEYIETKPIDIDYQIEINQGKTATYAGIYPCHLKYTLISQE